jgi:hypothetical protein
MSSLSHVHVEVAIKEFAAARRQIEALAQHASGPNLASGLSRERVEGRLGLDLCRLVSRHMGLRLVLVRLRFLSFLISFLSLRHGDPPVCSRLESPSLWMKLRSDSRLGTVSRSFNAR